MTFLISVAGWDNLLCIVPEESGQCQIVESVVPKAKAPGLYQYSGWEEVLQCWSPSKELRQ